MPITEPARKAIDDTLAALDPAIVSLQKRKDYAREDAPFKVPNMVGFFQAFQQKLQVCRARDDQTEAVALAGYTQKEAIPNIQAVVSSNIAISRMGQLNTRRTIEPETALEQNLLFDKLLKASMQFVASAQVPIVVPATATVAIRSITYASRHGGVNKLLRPDGVTAYLRADGQIVTTHLDDSAGAFNAAEWDIAHGGDGHDEPFSQTVNTVPTVVVVCRVAAQGGDVTVTGFSGRLNGTVAIAHGVALLNANFQIALNQNAANPNTPTVVNDGAYTDFTVTFAGAQNFPNEIGAATLALTLTAQTDAGNVAATAHTAGTVYLTFGAPGGAVQSLLPNSFTLGGAPQHVTPARLQLAILAVRLGANFVAVGPDPATNCVDAIFVFLKAIGVRFSLTFRWVPIPNTTGVWPQPPLHAYLWMSLSPTPNTAAPPGLPRTEAWAECHNLAVAFALMGEILGLTPFVVNFGGGAQLGYAVDYPLPRRQDANPYLATIPPAHGRLNQPYTRPVTDPFGNQGRQQLGFVDQNNGFNNFEGVTVFNNVRLYPLGECILEENNRDTNADNYYCYYAGNPDYVASPNVPVSFDDTRGLVPLFFAGDWINWFIYFGGWPAYWQNGHEPDPYPGSGIPGHFMWED